MKQFKLVSIIMVICGFSILSFINEARATIPIATKIVIHPSSTALVTGKTGHFSATVYDQNNKNMSGVKLIWSLTSNVAGCAITQNGVFTSTAGTTPLGTYTGLVQAEATNTSVLATASVSILQGPFKGGMFIGTTDCTTGCQGSNSSTIAIEATASAFKALGIDSEKGDSTPFRGSISKTGAVTASFTSHGGDVVAVTGNIEVDVTGNATGISGTFIDTDTSDPTQNRSGTFSFARSTTSGAGLKTGSWSNPTGSQKTGPLYAIFEDNGSFIGGAEHKDNGQLDFSVISGTSWVSDGAVDFTVPDGNGVTGGSGTCNSGAKQCSGELDGSTGKVGTWKLGSY